MSGQEKQRDVWSNQCEFFVSSLGLAVGLGNIWRFPYVCYQNGGGTFLIPYIVMLLFVGIPALFFEQSAGQYGREGVNKVGASFEPYKYQSFFDLKFKRILKTKLLFYPYGILFHKFF